MASQNLQDMKLAQALQIVRSDGCLNSGLSCGTCLFYRACKKETMAASLKLAKKYIRETITGNTK